MDSPAGSFESKCNGGREGDGIIAPGQVGLWIACFGPIYPAFAPADAAPECAPEIVHLKLCNIWLNHCKQSRLRSVLEMCKQSAQCTCHHSPDQVVQGWNHCIWPFWHIGTTCWARLIVECATTAPGSKMCTWNRVLQEFLHLVAWATHQII